MRGIRAGGSLLAVALVGAVLALAGSPGAGAQAPRCFGQSATIVAVPGERTVGTPGPDVIIGTRGPDVIVARGGNDRICSGGGNDRVNAGGGNDRVNLGRGNDRVNLGGGNDRAIGAGGNDQLVGRRGTDVLIGGPGDDSMNGGPGRDTCRQGPGTGPERNCELPAAAEPAPFPTACEQVLTEAEITTAAGIDPIVQRSYFQTFPQPNFINCVFFFAEGEDPPTPPYESVSGQFTVSDLDSLADARQAVRSPVGETRPLRAVDGYGDEAFEIAPVTDGNVNAAILFRCANRVIAVRTGVVVSDDFDARQTESLAAARQLANLADRRLCP